MTTPSYAILALLDLRPWTGYELTHQAQRSLLYVWPKSERLLCSEPKKLVEPGYATSHVEEVGGRTRNVYTINPVPAADYGFTVMVAVNSPALFPTPVSLIPRKRRPSVSALD